LEDLIDDDSTIENIWVFFTLETKLLTVVTLVIDGDVTSEIVDTNVNQVDTRVWLVVGVVEDEQKVISDETELDWGDVLGEFEGDLVHVVLVQGVDDKWRTLVSLGGVQEGLVMFADTVTVDQINSSDFLDLTRLVDVMDSSLGEFSHVENSALLVFWVVAQPVEEVEFWVDGERGAPLTDDATGLEVVDLKLVVGWGVVEDLFGTDLGEPVGVDTQDGGVVFVLWEFSLVHDLTSESVPHDVVPGLGEDEENIVWESVSLNVFSLEWKLDVVLGNE
jgi:hypothetical protein